MDLLSPTGTALDLLDGPHFVAAGRRVELPRSSMRLVVFLALYRRPARRSVAAGTLWPCEPETRASGNLRSALWRLRGAGIDVVEVDGDCLGLRPSVKVDLDRIDRWAGRLIEARPEPADLALPFRCAGAMDLLPAWYDDWVIFERERLRQRLLHALEALSEHLSMLGRHAEAVEAAMTAVCSEPLRESAQRVLLVAHRAEGNHIEVRRSYLSYCELLGRELGIRPSPELQALAR